MTKQTKLETILKNMHADFVAVGEASTALERKGDALSERVHEVYACTGKDADSTLNAVVAFVTAEVKAFNDKHPKPEGGSDTPQYKVWHKLGNKELHNPTRAINNALTELKLAKRVQPRASKGDAILKDAVAGKKDADRLKDAINAIGRIDGDVKVKDQAELFQALVNVKGITRKRMIDWASQ